MKDKIVAITGAGSGLGACIAKRFSAAGAKIVLLDISEKNMEGVAKELTGNSAAYKLDISDKKQVDAVFDRIYDEVGFIDRLVNCAGVGKYDIAENIEEKYVDAMIDINLKGTIFTTQAVLPRMKEKNEGYIINVVSMSGIRACATESVYCGSKFGVDGFSKAVAIEVEETNVNISNFYMGNMATNLWKGDRADEQAQFIKPEDMAEIIFENTQLRDNLVIEEVHIKNVRPQ
ncbi:MAG: SDR family oxidoreductase [Bacillota bacterium]|nr:SDR family oxidoreductase [Bacillota bacterium]